MPHQRGEVVGWNLNTRRRGGGSNLHVMATQHTQAPIQTERIGPAGDVLLVTIDRPRRRNAIDQESAHLLDEAMERLDHEEGIRAGILTGAGGFFCAGTDLSVPSAPVTERGGSYGLVKRVRRRPLIAAVEGFALGGGMEIALACDLVVAAEDATFGLPEALRGLVANCGALFRGAEKLTPNVALELLLTGERLGAERAQQLGFVNWLTQPGQAVAGALQMAEAISRSGPDVVADVLSTIGAARRAHEESLWDLTDQAAARSHSSAEAHEGVQAFFEKREPTWRAHLR